MSWLLTLVVLLVCAQPAQAQATSGQKFAFDYQDAELVNSAVVRFEMQLDAQAFTSVQIPPKANDGLTPVGYSTYAVPIPSTVTVGSHVVSFRACSNAFCSAPSNPLSFTLAVVPVSPSGVRIVK